MNNVICRLCFKISESSSNEFELLRNVVRDMLDLVCFKVNLHATEVPRVCMECKGKLQECLNFKVTRTFMEESLISSRKCANNKEKVNLDIKENINGKCNFEENRECRFCLKVAKCNITSKLHSYEQFLAICMPEMDLNATSEVSICDSCFISLESCANFIKICYEQETKIENYRTFTGIHEGTNIDLLQVLKYSQENNIRAIKQEISEEEKLLLGNGTPQIDVCVNTFNNITVVEEFMNTDGNANVHGATENGYTQATVCSKVKTELAEENLNDANQIEGLDEEIDERTDDYHINIGDNEDKYVLQLNRELDLKPDVNTAEASQFSDSDLQCGSNTSDLEVEESTNKDRSNTTNFQDCDLLQEIGQSPMRTGQSQSTNNFVTLMEIFGCKMCGLQTRPQHQLKFHLCYDPVEIRVYRCEICNYKTNKTRSRMNKHMKAHMDPSEMYMCANCEFKTRHKSSLASHMMTHRATADMTLFKCQVCNYQTRHKSALRMHSNTHDSSAAIKYQCEICFQLMSRKSHLKRHMIVHKDPSETEIFKCDFCAFETKYKKSLDVHKIIHKNDADTTMYKCDYCDYKSKRKCYVKQHMLVHDRPDARMYLCEICGFKSKHKNYLNVHMLRHDNSLKTRKYKCEHCDYHAKQKNHLITHMITHRSASEVEIFMCDVCQFRTKYKHIIRNHVARHRKGAKL